MSYALSSKASAGLASGQRVAGSRRATKPGRRTLVAMNAIELKAPPYPLDALEPHMSKSTFEYHWGKHHKTYVDNLNKQIAGKDWENKELEEIVLASWNNGSPTPEFNNAAQIWNHTFFWESMKPNGGGAPTGALAEAINRDFGSFDEFKNQFKQAGLTQFGSGWAWLNSDKSGKLSISKTPNAVLPVVEGKSPILTCDVWEHAYYIDYQNRRPDFIQTFMDKLINWDMVSQRYAAAQQ
ncbi:chloroplast Fe superoxide dismutase 1 precursor [Haematococcus lacustris]